MSFCYAEIFRLLTGTENGIKLKIVVINYKTTRFSTNGYVNDRRIQRSAGDLMRFFTFLVFKVFEVRTGERSINPSSSLILIT